MYGNVLMFIKFNFGTQHLNRTRHLFHSFYSNTQCILDPLHVYKPGFNMDEYSLCVCVYVFVCVHYMWSDLRKPDIMAHAEIFSIKHYKNFVQKCIS